jgi:replicative DNA helicase
MSEAPDLELAYLGACMTIVDAMESTSLIGDQFESVRYGVIFDAMRDRHGRGLGVSQATMSELYPDDARTIWSATDAISDVLQWVTHEELIRTRSVRRALRAAAMQLQQVADSPEADMDTLVTVARQAIDGATAIDARTATSMQDDIRDVLHEHRKSTTVYPTPFTTLNGIIGGFAPGRMTVVGARPGVGKSAIASQFAYELADHGTVVFATMEMDKGEVYSRIIAQQAGIYYGAMQGGMSDFLQKREDAWVATQVRDIRVLDEGTQTVQSIRAAVRAAQRTGPVAGVVVDYIHLLSTPQRIENETQRINEITRSLKQLAMDLRVPVIALSQLNRGGDLGMPSLKDLRGSGGIEQDADCVIFLYRDEMTAQSQLMVHVAKNRQGPNFQTFPLDWQGEFVRAVDPEMP